MRTLLFRVTLSHLLVTLGALGMLASLSPYLFQEYYLATERQRLLSASTGLASAAERLLRASPLNPDLDLLVHTSASVIEGSVTILTPQGRVLSESGTSPFSRQEALLDRATYLGFQTPTSVVWQPAEDLLLLGAPIRSSQGQFIVIVRKPVTGLAMIMRAQRLMTAFTALLAGVLAVGLALLLSKAISAPLVAMSRAAGRLAAEDFSVRVPEHGPDEVRSLAASLNHMARDLALAFAELQKTDKLRREFVANTSHELRAPLTSIRGFIEAVLDGTAEGPEQEKCLRVAAAEAERMSKIIEQLLQLSRLQGGVLDFEFEHVDLPALAHTVIETFETRLRARGVKIRLQADPMPVIEADPNRLAQVLVNLLDNALRYSPEGGEISVEVRAEGPRVRVTVADQGPGIPAQDLPDIWERFHKVDPARPRTDPGAGLGLAIVQEIINKHNGECLASNRPEGGAEIGFVLPMGQQQLETTDPPLQRALPG